VPTIKDLLDDLRAHGARISPTLYQHALGLAGK